MKKQSVSIYDKLTHDGKTLTVPEWADELGLTLEGMLRRLRYGEPEGWFKPNTGIGGRRLLTDSNGVTKPLSQWAEDLGLTESGMWNRINKKPESEWFLPRISQKKVITINGVSKTLEDWCDSIGIEKTTYRQRLLQGWSIEKALTTPRSASYVAPRNPVTRKRIASPPVSEVDPDLALKRFIENCRAQGMTDSQIMAEHNKRVMV